jgi:hypothetical protein
VIAEGDREAKVASDGADYLVVWSEGWSIRAARVNSSGIVLDPGGFLIASNSKGDGDPAVAFDGTNYLVVWADARFGCCSVYGTRVTRSGAVLDPDGIPIATRGREQTRPSVAFTGKNYLVAWADNRSDLTSTDIYGARVTPAGRVLDPRGFVISTARPPPATCRVPRVMGLTVAKARQRIRRAHCSVGGVRGPRSRRGGRVVSQRPRAGAIKAKNYPVRIVVRRPRR